MSKIVKQTTFIKNIQFPVKHTFVQADDGQYYLISSSITVGNGLETMVFSCNRSEDDPDEYSVNRGELWSAHYTDFTVQLWEHLAIVDNFEVFKSNGFTFTRLNEKTEG